MVPRSIAPRLLSLAAQFPVVTVTGPRQSGKTTLCRALFGGHKYVSLEPLDQRDFATSDPRGFLRSLGGPAVLDEVQHVPALFSYVQESVDLDPTPGRFILTGSQHFGLSNAIRQSLAGRTAVLELLPPALDELQRFPTPPADLLTTLWRGAYPRIHERGLDAADWLGAYVTTYLERDVRLVTNVGDLRSFANFLKLAAGRTGQEFNASSLARDVGISQPTVRAWLAVLEAGYICFRVPAWHANVRKQVVKAAKLHFLDSGLTCYLLGIRSPEELRTHPLRGAIFESWVASELYKAMANGGERPALWHYRESAGLEIDLLVQRGSGWTAIECKSGETVAGEAFAASGAFVARPGSRGEAAVVYGGDVSQRRSAGRLVSWREVGTVLG